jgi:polysaccharide biosynthesis/export protein
MRFYTSPLFRFLTFCVLISLCSCRAYKQNIMFRTDGDVNADKLKASLANAEKNYIIQANDQLDVQVFTNKGERILDPNGEFLKSLGVQGGTIGTIGRQQGVQGGGGQGQAANQQPMGLIAYIVQQDGSVKLPMVDKVKVAGLTLLEADSLLQTMYAKYYIDPFVATRVLNNRVFVLGSPGGRVISLYNDNMNLIEVIAAAGGIDRDGKAYNIRLVRGDLSDPMVQVIDLSTIDGMRKASLQVEANDIIYIEPVRRAFFEAVADVGPVFSLLTGTLTTYLVLKDLIK